jgi:ribosome-binding protein aMBF1 (putative translation factor)
LQMSDKEDMLPFHWLSPDGRAALKRIHTLKASPSELVFYDELIEALIVRRKELALSQSDLDQMIGVSESMVAKWESKSRLPGAFFFMCWAKALGVRIIVQEVTKCQEENQS